MNVRPIAWAVALGLVAAPAFAARTIEIQTPADNAVYPQPRVSVETPRANDDVLLTEDVADTLASDPRLSGRIGVEARRDTVTLSGLVTSSQQVDRAQRDAQSVPGVREVQNEIRYRLDG